MDDLRTEIRDAFEREQAAHPAAANLRYRVVRETATRPASNKNLQWIAVVATVMIALLIVVSLVASRLNVLKTGLSHPPPVGQHGTPPAGVNLLYVDELDHDGTFDAYDWNGKKVGALNLGPRPAGLRMSPDGQAFVSGLGAKGGNFEFFGRLGDSVGATTNPGAYGNTWADDNRSICFMTQDAQSFAYRLWLERPGQAAKSVADVAKDTSVGQSALNVLSCSLASDTAIVVRTTVAWPMELWTIRLSDGHAIAHHTYEAQTLASVVATADARYVAETSSAAEGNVIRDYAPTTVIRRVSDWTPVAEMDAGYVVLDFSGDGQSVLVRTQITAHGEYYAIFKWSTDGTLRTVWQYLTPRTTIAEYTSEPGGSSFALSFIAVVSDNSASWCGPGFANCSTALAVTIVHGDGSTVDIPGRYNPTW